MFHQLPETAEEVWMAVFLARINPTSGPPLRPNDAALAADEAKQAFEARAIYWAQTSRRDDNEGFPGVY